MSLDNDSTPAQPEQARLPWTRPTIHRRSASQAELLSGATPDGLGDQLS
jgi:hypothetical protein